MSSTQRSNRGELQEGRLSHPFPPIIDGGSRILILGTFPSITSLQENFYYSHPQNQFWRLLAGVLDHPLPQSVEEKRDLLRRNGIALWDMVASCRREGSLDSALRDVEVNDIEGLLKEYPSIEALFFTGRKSEALYNSHFSHLEIPTFYLPSPSPANRQLNFEEKLKKWSILRDFLR
ncbi:MAG: DNA-deoxyinosine glycosylase [Epsilonproteobacteria bacterium]|nr:DNA-deoxyinosine glycosylase [Campylobacterota bacterium]NPA57082.1 DNA-deoxyinosine glycosylase [Campylobacterota bacterium]